MDQEFIGISEASHILERSSNRVRQLIVTGQLTAVQTPYGRAVRRVDVERLHQRQQQQRPVQVLDS